MWVHRKAVEQGIDKGSQSETWLCATQSVTYRLLSIWESRSRKFWSGKKLSVSVPMKILVLSLTGATRTCGILPGLVRVWQKVIFSPISDEGGRCPSWQIQIQTQYFTSWKDEGKPPTTTNIKFIYNLQLCIICCICVLLQGQRITQRLHFMPTREQGIMICRTPFWHLYLKWSKWR